MKQSDKMLRRDKLRKVASTSDKLNKVLTDWDPIGVGAPQSAEEYRTYVSGIYSSLEREGDLVECLSQMLKAILGSGFDSSDRKQKDEVREIGRKLQEVYEISKGNK